MNQPQDKDLDRFWRDLRAGMMIPDELSPEEAERRMETAEDDAFTPKEIAAMVARATAEDETSEQSPEETRRSMGVLHRLPLIGQMSKAAAAILVSVLLLSAGAVVTSLLWKGSHDPTHTLRLRDAALILGNTEEPNFRRRSALGRMFSEINDSVFYLKQSVEFGGGFRSVSENALARLRAELSAPRSHPVRLPTIDNVKPLYEVVQNESAPVDDRIASLKTIGSESMAALTCILAAKIRVQNRSLEMDRQDCLRILRSRVQ